MKAGRVLEVLESGPAPAAEEGSALERFRAVAVELGLTAEVHGAALADAREWYAEDEDTESRAVDNALGHIARALGW